MAKDPNKWQFSAHGSRTAQRGGASVEMVAGIIIILVPVALVLFNLGLVVLAQSINSNGARDIARAIAASDPTGDNWKDAANKANSVVYIHNGFLDGPKVVVEKTGPPQITQAPDPQYGGPYQGTITVMTQMTVNLCGPGLPSMNFNATETYPLTYVARAKSGF